MQLICISRTKGENWDGTDFKMGSIQLVQNTMIGHLCLELEMMLAVLIYEYHINISPLGEKCHCYPPENALLSQRNFAIFLSNKFLLVELYL